MTSITITADHLLAVIDGAEWHWLSLRRGAGPAQQISDARGVVEGRREWATIYGYGGETGRLSRHTLEAELVNRLQSPDVDDELAQMDVTDYDVIIQRAIFGDVIYD